MSTKLTVLNVLELMLKRWWIIALAFILGGVSFFVVNKYFIDPVYTSYGSLYVNNVREKQTDNVSLSDMTTSQMLVWTYMELLKSNTFMNQVAQDSGLNYSADEIASMLTMSPKNDTEIMQVTIVSKNPEHSQILVNTILADAPAEINRVIKGGSTEVVDYAQLPKAPSGPRILFNSAVGALLGAVITAGLVLLRELLDNRIKDEDELVQKYNYPVLGTIPNID